MLIRFTVENFLSFRDRQTLDLMAVRTCKERKDENTFPISEKDSALRTVGLYGANASGKSNLFEAFGFCANFIQMSFAERSASESIETIPFLYDESSKDNPTAFELEFTIGNTWYKYAFALTDKVIKSEWLYAKDCNAGTFKPKFIRARENDEDGIDVKSFDSADDVIVEKTRDNALFLSTCAALAVPEALAIVRELGSYLFFSAGADRPNATARMIEDGQQKDAIVGMVSKADPSVQDLSVERIEIDTGRTRANGSAIKRTKYRVMMLHKNDNGGYTSLPLYGLGSLGTRKAFELAGPIFSALASGTVIFIDELDSRLHPILTRELIKLFNNPKTNPKNAQLIFNTHDTNLLNCKVYSPSRDKKEQLLRRDQIYFVERTGEFVSKIYSLVDFRDEDGTAVRNDASFEKEYLAGKYGAIPYIGELFLTEDEK